MKKQPMRKIMIMAFALLAIIGLTTDSQARISPNYAYDEGMRFFQEGNYKEAIRSFTIVAWYCVEEKLKKNWEMSEKDYEMGAMGYLYRGMSYIKLQQPSLAIIDFANAEKWSKGIVEVQMNIATEYYKMEKFDDSIRVYKKVLDQNPNLGLAHYFIGLAYMKKKDFSTSWEHATRAEELGVKYRGLIDKLEAIAPHRQ